MEGQEKSGTRGDWKIHHGMFKNALLDIDSKEGDKNEITPSHATLWSARSRIKASMPKTIEWKIAQTRQVYGNKGNRDIEAQFAPPVISEYNKNGKRNEWKWENEK